jgi:hypothetical protein
MTTNHFPTPCVCADEPEHRCPRHAFPKMRTQPPAPFVDRTPTPEMALVCVALWGIDRSCTLANLSAYCLQHFPYFACLSESGVYRHVSRYVEQCEAAGFVTTSPTSFAGGILVDITATGLIVAEGDSGFTKAATL